MPDPKDKDFDSFVRQQQAIAAEATAKPPFDPQKELSDWIARLNDLFANVKVFLKEYIDAGSITTATEDIELREDFSGPYIAPKMVVSIGLQKIEMIPIGTMLIGAKGRVDVIGRAGSSRLLLLNKGVTSPNQLISIQVVDPNKPAPERQKAVPQQIDWAWKIASRPPMMRFTDLNKESFFTMLMEVSNA